MGFDGFDWNEGNLRKIHGRGGKKLIRPISARPMHRKEIAKYEEEIAKVENR